MGVLVAGLASTRACRRQAYRRWRWARRCRPAARTLSLCTALLGLAAGGCSYQLGSLVENGEDKIKQSAAAGDPAAAGPSESDLAQAGAAVTDALAKNPKTTTTKWENPATGARGTITVVAAAYDQDGGVCRDFLASYVQDSNDTWLEGAACRSRDGRWEVRRLTPWKRT